MRDGRIDALGALDAASSDFSALLGPTDPASGVPSCPGWAVRDLAEHLGIVHRWATAVVVGGVLVDEGPGPAPGQALGAWFDEGVADLVATLRTTDPARPTWGFGPPPRVAAFWRRRQAHETAMHLVDLQLAAGLVPRYPEDLARDGIDEVAEVFFPRQVRLGRIAPLHRSLRLLPDDDTGPAVVLTGDGSSTLPSGQAADVTVVAPAEVLVRLLWGRTALDDPALEVIGDAGAAAEVLGAGIVP